MVVLSGAGLQVPEIPLVEVVGSGSIVSPKQIGAIGSKVGVITLL